MVVRVVVYGVSGGVGGGATDGSVWVVYWVNDEW